MPERAVYWPARLTLIVADVHFGKAHALRVETGIVPSGTTEDDIARLDGLVTKTSCRRLIVLGDLLHSRPGVSRPLVRLMTRWRKKHPRLDITLVRGNHDRGSGDPPPEWEFICVDEPLVEFPFQFRHKPEEHDSLYALAGHLHPAVRLIGPGHQIERLPCFLVNETLTILPAFGSLTGHKVVRPDLGDKVFVIAQNEVLRIS